MDYKENLIECILTYASNVYNANELELMTISELTRLMSELACQTI